MHQPLHPVAIGSAPRRNPIRRMALFAVAALMLAALPQLGAPQASAHDWSTYHWHRGGSKVDMYIWDQTGGCGNSGTPTNDALYDIYYNPHPIWIYCTNYHTDVSVWEANDGASGYCGLATIDRSGSHILHAHAMVNTYQPCIDRRLSISGLTVKLYKQGIHCQEIMHAFGFDHSDTKDCMGGTTGSYFAGSKGKYFVGSSGAYVFDWDHQTVDMWNKYRYH